ELGPRFSFLASTALEELVLLGDRRIQLRLEQGNSTLRLPDIKAVADLEAQQLVRDVERRHHRDAVGAAHLARLLDLAHLAVEVGYRFHQRFALTLFAGDLVIAAENADLDGFRALGHGGHQSGMRASRLSSFTLAPSMRSFRRFASFLAVASCCRRSWFSARSRSHRPTNCATLASRELNSASTPELCCKTATAS